jgi:hypothetical protein
MSRAGEFYYEGLPRYITALEEWFYPEQLLAYQRAVMPSGACRLMLGIIVYGAYVDRFLNICVPSLLLRGNIAALDDPLIVIHTDAASVAKIEAGIDELRRHARIEIHMIPEFILAMVPENRANKYWLLGAAHNLHMQQAKYRAHDYHMLMPDHVYAAGYFENLVRLRDEGKRAIVQGAMSANIDRADLALEAAAKGPEHVAAFGLDNLHDQIAPFIMNGRDDFPSNIYLLMIGEREAQIASPHMSIVYLSHEVLMRAPLRLFNTVDGQLPFFIPEDVEAYVPVPDDGMAYVELSDRNKEFHRTEGCDLTTFCAKFWIMVSCHEGFRRFFETATVLRFPDGYVPPVEPMKDEEISALRAKVSSSIKDILPALRQVLPPFMQKDPLLRLIDLEKEEAA